MAAPASEMTAQHNFVIPDLVRLYSESYDDKMLKWRAIGAEEKSRNIETITAGVAQSINSVLEVGCGTGAVLKKLSADGLGSQFVGIEIGDSARTRTNQNGNESRSLEIHGYDGKHIPYEDESFDLVYATHVLEHVTDERGFLHELRRVSRRYVYLEVPCELHMRTSFRALQETLNIGHINCYTPESFALTLETSGLKVKKLKVFDLSYAMQRYHSTAARTMVKATLRKILLATNEKLATRVFTFHCGALCEKGAKLNLS